MPKSETSNDVRSQSPRRLSTLHECTEPNTSTYTNDPDNRSSRRTFSFSGSIRNSLRSLSTTPFSLYPSTDHASTAKPEDVVFGQAQVLHLNRPEEGWFKKFRSSQAFWPVVVGGVMCLILLIFAVSVSIWEVTHKSPAATPMNASAMATFPRSRISVVTCATDSSGVCTTADSSTTTSYHQDGTIGTTFFFTTTLMTGPAITSNTILSSLLTIDPVSDVTTISSTAPYSAQSQAGPPRVTTTRSVAAITTSIPAYTTTNINDRAVPRSTSEAVGHGKGQALLAMILCWVALFILYDER